jgi:DNA-directed RNA polymerase specialized sigma54-like protein
MGNNFAQKQSARQGFGFQTRLAGLLEMPSEDYFELIREIESDPVFVKLKYAQDKAERALRTRRLQQTDLSRRFFELKEGLVAGSGNSSTEVEKLLAEKEKLMETIRAIGEEKFTKHFIYNENELSIEDIAGDCGLSRGEVKQILWLVNTVDIHSEFSSQSANSPDGSVFYNKVAVLSKTFSGIAIQFTSAHWSRGLYEIDYAKIERMRSSGKLSEEENKQLKILLQKIELINVKKSIMYGIISRIIEKQRKYFRCHQESGLVPFLQLELAKDMNVHPSIISRATAGRSLEMPWGEEKPLKELFCSDKLSQRKRIMRYIKEIFKDEKTKILKGLLDKPISDKAVAALLHEKYALDISPRTAAKYRNLMKLPSAFCR